MIDTAERFRVRAIWRGEGPSRAPRSPERQAVIDVLLGRKSGQTSLPITPVEQLRTRFVGAQVAEPVKAKPKPAKPRPVENLVLPDTTSPEALAAQMNWSARRVRQLARKLGACRVIGNRMTLTKDDVEAILENSRPCPLKSINEEVSGITGGPLPSGDYAALRALRTKKPRNGSRQKLKTGPGNVV